MDMYTASEEAYKRGYEAAKAQYDHPVKSIDLMEYGCVILTMDAIGHTRMITSKKLSDIWDDWNNDAEMCPANDAPVFFLIVNGVMVFGNNGSTFESTMMYIKKLLKKH